MVTQMLDTTQQSEQVAIRQARIAQNQALAAQDVERAASFWTEDITIRRALGQAADGKAQARQIIEPVGDPRTRLIYQRQTTMVEVSAQWPLAFEEGTWVGHRGDVNGPVVMGGRYAAQWVKRAEGWLIRSELFVALHCADAGCDYSAVP